MKNKKHKYLFFLFIIILLIQIGQNNNNNLENVINNNYGRSYSENSIIDIKLDSYFSGNINNNTNFYYKLHLLNDTEQIFFDYQSDYGCLYINIENEFESNNSNFKYCSEGINNIFILDKSEILEIIDKNDENNINNLTIFIKIGLTELELEQNDEFEFDYSLKVSLRKPVINILEINSEHKILCKTENISDNNYRCIFMIVNYSHEENNKNLIIYSNIKNNIKLNIYADYINKSEYENYNIDYLNNNIPNNSSMFNNSNTENEFIIIPDKESDKYIYLSIEMKLEATIELLAQYISYNNTIFLPNINDLKVYSFTNDTKQKDLYFDVPSLDKISFSLVTLYGKASIYFENYKEIEYITDVRENRISFDVDLNSRKKKINYNLKINKLETDFIFYIYYTKQSNNTLNELEYGKSKKIFYNNYITPIILYEQIPNINLPININLQIYNTPTFNLNYLDIEVILISQKELYYTKLNQTYINKYNKKIRSKFDPILLASNIYITSEDMESFNSENDLYLIISMAKLSPYNSFGNEEDDKLIIGATIFQKNSLIYPSERIYHYGKLYNEEKVVYRLKGYDKYHLMRLEFSSNSNYIEWSVKRTYNDDDDNYKYNDTDLSFVTEIWSNGRGLITMFIENGEDIYLTIFINKIVDNYNLTNFIFKYINSEKNGDFNNFIIKYDSLEYNKEKNKISINKLNNYPTNSIINYFLKITNKDNYISNEHLNTIAIRESWNSSILNGENINNKIQFNLNSLIDKKKIYYINAYCIINTNYSDIEYISFNGLIINKKFIHKSSSNKKLILASLILGGIAFLVIIFKCLRVFCCRSCCKCCSRRRISLDLAYNDDSLLDIEYNDDNDTVLLTDELLLT